MLTQIILGATKSSMPVSIRIGGCPKLAVCTADRVLKEEGTPLKSRYLIIYTVPAALPQKPGLYLDQFFFHFPFILLLV